MVLIAHPLLLTTLCNTFAAAPTTCCPSNQFLQFYIIFALCEKILGCYPICLIDHGPQQEMFTTFTFRKLQLILSYLIKRQNTQEFVLQNLNYHAPQQEHSLSTPLLREQRRQANLQQFHLYNNVKGIYYPKQFCCYFYFVYIFDKLYRALAYHLFRIIIFVKQVWINKYFTAMIRIYEIIRINYNKIQVRIQVFIIVFVQGVCLQHVCQLYYMKQFSCVLGLQSFQFESNIICVSDEIEYLVCYCLWGH
eukprot:TRINITY_DN23546_c0_g1_i2.p1 TRINITY_DN23546_c0_g1~~TRINITY_DN23546_c0_g1_i2.p1  ORF type:complete len:250 (-),score=-15.22 TRINITY_DN23546_c0_g1_i2:102-851(-)